VLNPAKSKKMNLNEVIKNLLNELFRKPKLGIGFYKNVYSLRAYPDYIVKQVGHKEYLDIIKAEVKFYEMYPEVFAKIIKVNLCFFKDNTSHGSNGGQTITPLHCCFTSKRGILTECKSRAAFLDKSIVWSVNVHTSGKQTIPKHAVPAVSFVHALAQLSHAR